MTVSIGSGSDSTTVDYGLIDYANAFGDSFKQVQLYMV